MMCDLVRMDSNIVVHFKAIDVVQKCDDDRKKNEQEHLLYWHQQQAAVYWHHGATRKQKRCDLCMAMATHCICMQEFQ